MEHVVIFVCIQIQLQRALCCTYSIIFITIFEFKHNLCVASGSAAATSPPPRPSQGKILGARLLENLFKVCLLT
jgi:hypothetical protein